MPMINSIVWKHCIPEAMIVFDTIEGNVLFANEYMVQLLGYKYDDFVNIKITEIDVHTPNYLSWQAQFIALKHSGRVLTKSLYLHRNGHFLPVEIASSYCNEGMKCVICIVHDISQYTEQTEKISISLQEKEHLLKEIHHRVKNNLQTISSLLTLGRKKIKDKAVADVLQESQNRIHAIATVHEILYKSDHAGRVDMSRYIRLLTNSLVEGFGALGNGVLIEQDVEPFYFLMDTAMPCGLIINELVSNAFQHAFDAAQIDKKIIIALYANNKGCIILKVTDNGNGFNITEQDSTVSVGLKLVNILAKQLDANIEIDSGKGATFQLTFKALDMIEGGLK
jgi:PAS domain S-box-containing protein